MKKRVEISAIVVRESDFISKSTQAARFSQPLKLSAVRLRNCISPYSLSERNRDGLCHATARWPDKILERITKLRTSLPNQCCSTFDHDPLRQLSHTRSARISTDNASRSFIHIPNFSSKSIASTSHSSHSLSFNSTCASAYLSVVHQLSCGLVRRFDFDFVRGWGEEDQLEADTGSDCS